MRPRGQLRSCLIAALLCFGAGDALAQSAPSAADLQTARAAFRQGMALRAAGKASEALQHLRTAHDLAHTPITALELGRTLVSAGRVVEGTETLLEVQRLPKAYDESARGAAARVEAAKLAAESSAKIATLRVTLEGGSRETLVKIDGESVQPTALAVGRKVDPGTHEVVASNPRAEESKLRLELAPGESKDVTLSLKPSPTPPPVVVVPPPVVTPPVVVAPPPPPPPRPPPPAPPPSTTWKTVAFVGFGVAGAGAIAGTITGVVALGAANNAKTACAGTQCPSDAFSRIESGRTAATVSTVAFAVGGAGLAVGITALFMKPKEGERASAGAAWGAPAAPRVGRVAPWVGLGSAGVEGTF